MPTDEGEAGKATFDVTVRYIFLDTNVFYRIGFDMQSSLFNSIENLALSGRIKIILTDIVYDEIAAGVEERLLEAKSAFEGRWEKFRILSLGDPPIINEPKNSDFANHHPKIMASIDAFLEKCGALRLPIDTVSTTDVMALYFSRQAPFGKERKKHEFPDAISLLCLEKFAAEHLSSIYLVSDDPDIGYYCETSDRLLPCNDLSALVAAYISSRRTAQIEQSLSSDQDSIFSSLIDDIDESIIDVDLDDVDILHSAFSDHEVDSINVISVEHGEFVAEVGFSTYMELELDYLSWRTKYSSALDDYTQGRRRLSVRRRVYLWAEVTGSWNPREDVAEISSVTHSFPDQIQISVDES